ncbi:hypothetical protein DFQ13_104572 [Actinokineospora spheciospongiae]|nr:hypothetical protein DFQ13_104572 [Actinokineospora spheciospongiae]
MTEQNNSGHPPSLKPTPHVGLTTPVANNPHNTAPNTIRYHTNTMKLCFATYFNNHATHAYPTTNDTTVATTVCATDASNGPEPSAATMSGIENNPAPNTAGIANRNEYRVDASRFNPTNNPAVNVPPDRDTPGINANACANPIDTVSRNVNASRACRAVSSATAKNTANTINTIAVIHRFRKPDLIWSWNNTPSTLIGTDPMITYHAIRYSGVRRAPALNKPRNHAAINRPMSLAK